MPAASALAGKGAACPWSTSGGHRRLSRSPLLRCAGAAPLGPPGVGPAQAHPSPGHSHAAELLARPLPGPFLCILDQSHQLFLGSQLCHPRKRPACPSPAGQWFTLCPAVCVRLGQVTAVAPPPGLIPQWAPALNQPSFCVSSFCVLQFCEPRNSATTHPARVELETGPGSRAQRAVELSAQKP